MCLGWILELKSLFDIIPDGNRHDAVCAAYQRDVPDIQVSVPLNIKGADWLLPVDKDNRGDEVFTAGFAHFGMAMPRNAVSCSSSAASLSLVESADFVAFFTQQLADATFERNQLVQIKIRE